MALERLLRAITSRRRDVTFRTNTALGVSDELRWVIDRTHGPARLQLSRRVANNDSDTEKFLIAEIRPYR